MRDNSSALPSAVVSCTRAVRKADGRWSVHVVRKRTCRLCTACTLCCWDEHQRKMHTEHAVAGDGSRDRRDVTTNLVVLSRMANQDLPLGVSAEGGK